MLAAKLEENRGQTTRGTQLVTNLGLRSLCHILFSRPLLELCKLDGGGDQSLPLLPTSTSLWPRNNNIFHQPLLLLREYIRPESFPFLVAFSEGRHGCFEQGAVFGVKPFQVNGFDLSHVRQLRVGGSESKTDAPELKIWSFHHPWRG